jgi:hypothetical protein
VGRLGRDAPVPQPKLIEHTDAPEAVLDEAACLQPGEQRVERLARHADQRREISLRHGQGDGPGRCAVLPRELRQIGEPCA